MSAKLVRTYPHIRSRKPGHFQKSRCRLKGRLADPDKLLNQRHLYKTMDGITNQRKHGALQDKHFSHSYDSWDLGGW